MAENNFFEKLRRFDAYPKTLEDFRVKTFGGALGLFTGFLIISVLNRKIFMKCVN